VAHIAHLIRVLTDSMDPLLGTTVFTLNALLLMVGHQKGHRIRKKNLIVEKWEYCTAEFQMNILSVYSLLSRSTLRNIGTLGKMSIVRLEQSQVPDILLI